jgi:hypothetical protein
MQAHKQSTRGQLQAPTSCIQLQPTHVLAPMFLWRQLLTHEQPMLYWGADSSCVCMAAQLPLAVILPFVTGALQGLGEQRRSVAIVRSLRRAGNLAARAELVQCKQR